MSYKITYNGLTNGNTYDIYVNVIYNMSNKIIYNGDIYTITDTSFTNNVDDGYPSTATITNSDGNTVGYVKTVFTDTSTTTNPKSYIITFTLSDANETTIATLTYTYTDPNYSYTLNDDTETYTVTYDNGIYTVTDDNGIYTVTYANGIYTATDNNSIYTVTESANYGGIIYTVKDADDNTISTVIDPFIGNGIYILKETSSGYTVTDSIGNTVATVTDDNGIYTVTDDNGIYTVTDDNGNVKLTLSDGEVIYI